MEDSRDSANIRHFISRSQQPKVLSSQPKNKITPTPANIYLVFDQGFANQVDDTSFRYIGTSPQINQYESMTTRRRGQELMRDSFSN